MMFQFFLRWTVNKWLDKEEKTNNLELKASSSTAIKKVNAAETPRKPTTNAKYKLTIKTADESRVGTDSKVNVKLVGTQYTIGEIVLDEKICKNEKKKDLFEKGSQDVFEFENADIGQVN